MKWNLTCLLAVIITFIGISCSKVDPILPEDHHVDNNETTGSSTALAGSPWITIMAGSHSLTNENECQIATTDIMGYINVVAQLDKDDPQYTVIRQYVYDCFRVLQQIQLKFKENGEAQLAPIPGVADTTNGTWSEGNDTVRITLNSINVSPSASIYTKQFAQRFGGGTFPLKKEKSTLVLQIDGHFVCDPIVNYAYQNSMASSKTLEDFSNVFGGFSVVLAQSISEEEPPQTPNTPPDPSAKEVLTHEWRIIRAGSKKDVTSEAGIIASANATMKPINIFYTHLKEGSSEYNGLRDEVAKCYRLFGEMNIKLYQSGKATIEGPSGFNGAAQGQWTDLGDGNFSIQLHSTPLKKTANRFEKRFADDFLTSPIRVNYNKKTGDRTWHIHGSFVVEPCGTYVAEHGLPGYDGIMRFSKIFKGFDLHLEAR